MSLYQQAIASRRHELFADLAECERELATAESFYAHAEDKERERAATWCSDVAGNIEAIRDALEALDDGAWAGWP